MGTKQHNDGLLIEDVKMFFRHFCKAKYVRSLNEKLSLKQRESIARTPFWWFMSLNHSAVNEVMVCNEELGYEFVREAFKTFGTSYKRSIDKENEELNRLVENEEREGSTVDDVNVGQQSNMYDRMKSQPRKRIKSRAIRTPFAGFEPTGGKVPVAKRCNAKQCSWLNLMYCLAEVNNRQATNARDVQNSMRRLVVPRLPPSAIPENGVLDVVKGGKPEENQQCADTDTSPGNGLRSARRKRDNSGLCVLGRLAVGDLESWQRLAARVSRQAICTAEVGSFGFVFMIYKASSGALKVGVKHVVFLELWLRIASLELWLGMADEHEEPLSCGSGWREMCIRDSP
ncbi:hypothetical protein DEO72_LG3g976 [Vigna unguiculata]|uniref:Uncharacterized protein n=1 Tax=Vigna unguiculata TaxID=3917 RepID=A0A4D6LD86_VIGUN|nr:hypothetical protein DEO72_LG3g976 [Vigna unguiculata]